VISKKIILVVFLFYSCTAFSGTPDSSTLDKPLKFDLNGVKPGDKLTEEFFNKHCPSRLKGSSEIECKQRLELNGIKISILYFFYDEKLLAISFNYPSLQYDDLIRTYTRKFSRPPHNKKEDPILLSTGVKYTNKKASWNTASGEFVIEQYWNGFNKGSAHLLSLEYEKYKIRKSKESTEGVIEKIFGDIFD
jgi:hypothetical protein